MATKKVSFETAGNHWYWRSKNERECQTGTVVSMPERARLKTVSFKVGGLDFNDPVYGYQHHRGRMRPAIWDYNTGAVLTKGSYTVLPISSGGTMPWVSFDLADVWVEKGQKIIIGFWRDSSTSSYATQWDYNTNATGLTMVSHDLFGSESGPFTFKRTGSMSGTSINFILNYSAGGKLKVFDTTGTWRTVDDVKVYDGDRWDSAEVRIFNDTAWEVSKE